MATWLQNMKLDRVSLVKRGANRRRFTLFKQAGKTKTEDGAEFPAAAYAYVPDPESPSTWKLRLWESPEKKVTARQVGMAVAALGPGGFRGNRVQIPAEDLPAVKGKVRRAWKQANPDAGEVPSAIKSQEDDPMDLKELIKSIAGMSDEDKAEIRKALELKEGDVFERLTQATDEQKAELMKALGIEPESDESLKARVLKMLGLKPAEEPASDLPDAVRKAVDDVRAELKKEQDARAAAEDRLKKAEDLIAKHEREARVAAMVTKAARFGHLGTADDLSKLLSEVEEKAGGEVLTKLETVLAKGEELASMSKAFEEIGVRGSESEAGNVIEKIDAAAEEIRKADPKLTVDEARAQAWRDNPELFQEYQQQRRRAIARRGEE